MRLNESKANTPIETEKYFRIFYFLDGIVVLAVFFSLRWECTPVESQCTHFNRKNAEQQQHWSDENKKVSRAREIQQRNSKPSSARRDIMQNPFT